MTASAVYFEECQWEEEGEEWGQSSWATFRDYWEVCKDMPDHDQIISMTILMKHVAAVAAKSLQGRIWKKKNQIAYIDLHWAPFLAPDISVQTIFCF